MQLEDVTNAWVIFTKPESTKELLHIFYELVNIKVFTTEIKIPKTVLTALNSTRKHKTNVKE